MSAQVIAFTGQKGGVGKTTSVANLGAALQEAGGRVLLVDLDFGADLTEVSGVTVGRTIPTISEVLLGEVSAKEAIIACHEYDLLPASPAFKVAERELDTRAGRDLVLRRALRPVLEAYDWILVDCEGGLRFAAMNGLGAATAFVAVLHPEPLALRHVDSLFEVAGDVVDTVNPELGFAGYLPARYNASKGLHAGELAEIVGRAAEEGAPLLPTIRENIAVAEAQKARQSVLAWKPRSHAAQDYRAVAKALIGQVADHG